MKESAFRIFFIIAFLGLLSLTATCGGGGGGGGGGSDTGGGWATITSPSSEGTYTATCNTVTLSGDAFISPTWWGCCAGTAQEMTGVAVTWRNETTGGSGQAAQHVEVGNLFGTPFLGAHTWWATIPLALGDNRIIVTATDLSSLTGQDAIVVNGPGPMFAISGRAATQNAEGLWGITITLSQGGTSRTASTFSDGSYSFSCVANGTYTLTASSGIGYDFSPPITVTVGGGDVTGQNFSTEAYMISGTVYDMSGNGIGAMLSLNGSITAGTGDGGEYEVPVPNGTYTIQVATCYPSPCPMPFTPAERTVTVDHADVTGQDFHEL